MSKERLEQLERENKLLKFIAEENKIACEQIMKQNKRYQEALEEIASEDEWETVDEARGMARQALEDGE